jgi:predicted ATPase
VYLERLSIVAERITSTEYPFHLPALRALDLTFTSDVTFFVGENGTGKSTVIEAIAALCRLPVSGGGRVDLGAGHGPESESALSSALRPVFRVRPPDAYFLRSEFQGHFASLLDARKADPDFTMTGDPYAVYGGRSLYTRSHGEAFLAILQNRIRSGLLLFDEPESALSPQRQLVLLAHMVQLSEGGAAQFIIATHSPILLTFPGARLLSFDGGAIHEVSLENTSHYQITRGILNHPDHYWRYLGTAPAPSSQSQPRKARKRRKPGDR